MIEAPHNDQGCLVPATEQVIAEVEAGNPALVELAEKFCDTDEMAAWFRTLPQRDDEGLPCDGPKVTECRPPQRLRFDAEDPNCFERASRWVGAAELIDPDHVYQLATLETENGLHTFPTRDGEPVILDPIHNRNALRAGLTEDVAVRRLRLERLIGTDETRGVRGDLARARKAKKNGHTTWVHGEPIDNAIASYERALATYQKLLAEIPRNKKRHSARNAANTSSTPSDAIDWIAQLAMEPAQRFVDGTRRVECGHLAIRGVLVLRPICAADARDVAFLLALAEREARQIGPAGVRIVHSTARAIDQLDQIAAQRARKAQAEPSDSSARNAGPFELHIGNQTIRPDLPLIGSLARVGGRLAGNVGLEALKLKLASLGIGPPVLSSLERELNREGLSLGPLASPPPMLGSLGALTPEALAGRWLAQKI